MKKIILFLSVCTIVACKNPEKNMIEMSNSKANNQKFESKTLSFNYSDDWKITDNEEIEEGIYYLAIEKNGFDSSGLITVVSFDDIYDLDELVMMNIEQIQDNPVVSNFKFESIIDSQFNTLKSRSTSFKFSTIGIRHEGLVSAFSGENTSYVILKQGAIEDKEKNSKGFSTFENSFTIK